MQTEMAVLFPLSVSGSQSKLPPVLTAGHQLNDLFTTSDCDCDSDSDTDPDGPWP
jgi:hypothetical protein